MKKFLTILFLLVVTLSCREQEEEIYIKVITSKVELHDSECMYEYKSLAAKKFVDGKYWDYYNIMFAPCCKYEIGDYTRSTEMFKY